MPLSNDLITQWASQQGLNPHEAGAPGRLSINLDRVRLHLVALDAERVLLETRVLDLPLAAHERERALEQALRLATARLRDGAAALAAHEDGQSLWLQATLPAEAGIAALTELAEQVCNEADLWRGAL